MSDETALQLYRSLGEGAKRAERTAAATSCPTCGAHFSREGRFCPFDRSPLVLARGWDPSTSELLGQVVDGRYQVVSLIGEGGMGVVYEVRHTLLGRRFALKALRKELSFDQELAARFIQEARTAAAISHPGLVEITDFGRLESGQVYFVMELLEGSSLAALLRGGGALPAARGLDIVRQLARALKAAHDAGVVHRDLKPDNIHVGRGEGDVDRVKVVDFGLAKVIGTDRVTRAGMVFGTPHYMSPEQAAGEPVDHRADIYALGVVMYEMFTGKVPFEADTYMGVLTKHLYVLPVPPSTLNPELKSLGALEEVVLCALQKRPDARYENLAALLADLDRKLPSPPSRSTMSLLADQLELPLVELHAQKRGDGVWRALALLFVALAAGAICVALAGRTTRLEPRVGPAAPASLATGRPALGVTPEPTSDRAPAAPVTISQRTGPSHPIPARKPANRAQKAPLPKASAEHGARGLAVGAAGDRDIVDPWQRAR